MNDLDLNTPPVPAPPYTGNWTLTARRWDCEDLTVNHIRTFSYDDGIWFVSNDVGDITAVAIANWDEVQIVKDE
jgi:hypothetical protein